MTAAQFATINGDLHAIVFILAALAIIMLCQFFANLW